MGCRALERRGVRRRLAVALAGLAVLLATGSAAAQERVALVIGNGAYEQQGRLPNPPNDAADMGAALDRLGFQVTSVIDADVDAMLDALDAFETRAASADVALVFFVGHGIEVAGRNYLIPVDAELAREDRVDREAISLDRLLEKTAGARLQLVILDACRNNPFAERMARDAGGGGRGGWRWWRRGPTTRGKCWWPCPRLRATWPRTERSGTVRSRRRCWSTSRRPASRWG